MVNITKIIETKVFPSLPGGQILVCLYSTFFYVDQNIGSYVLGWTLYTSVFYLIAFGIVYKRLHDNWFVPFWCSVCLFTMTLVDWQREYTNYQTYSKLYDVSIFIICIGIIIFKYSKYLKDKKNYQRIKRF